ncbi:ABC transporter ATP-binding protein [candidate division KSB1 bacterium]
MIKAFKSEGLVKTYPGFQLGPLDLELEPGVVMGYIGPNGSGKTTTIHCLLNLLKREEGEISIFGEKVNNKNIEWKYNVGYVGDIHVFYEKWSGKKNLKFLSQFFPNWSDKYALELANRFDIDLNKKAIDLSTGNRAKLALIAVLARNPKLLVLDEPIFNLDVAVRSEVLDVLFEFMKSGENSIFYSTHNILDISRLVDKLVFIDNGTVHTEVYKDDLLSKWRRISFQMTNTVEFEPLVLDHRNEGKEHQVVSPDYEVTLRQLNSLGAENIEQYSMNLEEIARHIIKGDKNVDYSESRV